ncbi:MAG: hypothetical protein H7270_08210 [Dermatophilaceae bacterium]|nr:hypothetical protein [Dermatophilaceae bacterium]
MRIWKNDGSPLLLRQGQIDRGHRIIERVADLVDSRDLHGPVAVQGVAHDHHRVVAFLDGLPVEVSGSARQIVGIEPDGDRDVLLAGGELVAHLSGEKFGEGRGRCSASWTWLAIYQCN